VLQLNHACLTLGQSTFDFSLQIDTHSLHAIHGRSGSGKSTLLNLIAGFVLPTSGEIRWQGESLQNISAENRPVTTLFQQNNLFSHLTVLQNVGLGRHPGLQLTDEDHDDIEQVLDRVGLTGQANKRPSAMSGGEQQRVALARSLLRNRPILLLDEPFSALDASTRQEMISLTKDVIAQNNPCVLMVTHNTDDAVAMDAKVLTVEDGRLVANDSA